MCLLPPPVFFALKKIKEKLEDVEMSAHKHTLVQKEEAIEQENR